MKHLTFILLVLMPGLYTLTFSQKTQNIRTSNTQVRVEQLADSTLAFLYDGLKDAVIFYTDGSTSKSRLNYSILLDQFNVQTSRGSGPLNFRDVDRLEVNGSIFIYQQGEGYLEVIRRGRFPLFLKRLIRVSTMPVRRGAYGGTDHTSAIDVSASITTNSGSDFDRQIFLDNPSGQEMDITLRYNEYFLIEKEGSFLRINNQRQMLRDFPEFRSQLRDFIRKEKINFSNTGDLTKLVKFMEEL